MGKNRLTGVCLSLIAAGLFLGSHPAPTHETAVPMLVREDADQKDLFKWKKFHSVSGKCSISFPETPEHIRQNMSVPEDEVELSYDVYVAADGGKAVYMVLIAQYPSYIDESYAELSLESFLNGILSQHPANQLESASLIEVQGHKGMDFFVSTKGVYFKGRAVMAKNHLYLMAMECEQGNYKDMLFAHFINSFELQN